MSELPKGWENTTLKQVVDKIVGGGTPSKDVTSYYQGEIPWMTVKDMNKSYLTDTIDHITEEAVKNSSTNIIPAGVLIIATRMSLGKVVTAAFDTAINQDLKALFVNKEICQKYFEYWYRSQAMKIDALGTGTTVKGIRLEVLHDLELPLAPQAEQTRIVEKLDEVLAQVDTIKARLDGIPAILKRFRQSVLAAAVSGKLTAEWRGIDSSRSKWIHGQLGNFVKIDRGSSPRPIKDYITDSDDGVHWIRIGDAVAGCKYINSTEQKITKEGALKSRRVYPGDFILSNSMSLGKPYIMDIDGYVHDGWFVLRLPEFIETNFFYYVLSSNELQNQFTLLAVGGVVQNIRSELVKQALVSVPPLEEQKEIVRLVEQYFAFADIIEAQVKKAQTRVNNLTQSILAKAFRGELVAQDPSDEPAEKLLERIAQARKEAEALAKAAKKVAKTK